MLQFYEVRLRFKFADCGDVPYIRDEVKTILIDRENLEQEKKKYCIPIITWNNAAIAWKYCIWGKIKYPFYCRGEEVEIVDREAWDYEPTILTPKKNPNMKIICVPTFTPIQLSIKEIMEWAEGDKAIQYLNEHGLGIVM